MTHLTLNRRAALRMAALGAFAPQLFSGLALAQTGYPDKPVTLVLPFPPGAIVDNVGRKLSQRLGEIWKVTVVPENKPGAGGNLGGSFVAKARPDGYTLLLSQYDSMVIAKAGKVPIGYDPAKDLTPVAQVGLSATLFLVNADSKFQTFQQFMQHVRDNPGKVNFGSNGHGGSYHLGIEQLNAIAKTQIQHIPYKGGAPSMLDLLAGRVDAILASTSLGMPQLKAGKVRVLALGSSKRSPLYPGVPTIAELGYPGFDVSLGLGVFAPAGTPQAIVAKINADVNAALGSNELKQGMSVEGVEPTIQTPAQFAAVFNGDIARTEALLQRLNLKLE